MVNCSAYGCQSRSEKKELGVTFHSFPVDPEKRKLWLASMQIEIWTPNKNCRLCSKHFEKRWFYKSSNMERTRLLHQAVPTIFTELPKELQLRKVLNGSLNTVEITSTQPASTSAAPEISGKRKLRKTRVRKAQKSQLKNKKSPVPNQSLKRPKKNLAQLSQHTDSTESSAETSELDSDFLETKERKAETSKPDLDSLETKERKTETNEPDLDFLETKKRLNKTDILKFTQNLNMTLQKMKEKSTYTSDEQMIYRRKLQEARRQITSLKMKVSSLKTAKLQENKSSDASQSLEVSLEC